MSSVPAKPFDGSKYLPRLAANLLIVALMLIAYGDADYGYYCGAAFVLLLCILGAKNPKETLFFIFGIKLTLDLMWWVPPPESLPIPLRITQLAVIPVTVCLLSMIVNRPIRGSRATTAGIVFVAWCLLAQIANSDAKFNPEVVLRVSGSLIGFLIGALFITSRQELGEIVKLALLSTVVPLTAAVLQVFATLLDMPIFFYTLGSTRGARFAGLNHDSGGLGLIALVGLLGAIYLLYSNAVRVHWNKYLYSWVGLSFFLMAAGGTRSVFFTAVLALAAFLVIRFNKGVKVVPFVVIALWFAHPYIEKMHAKNLRELRASGMTTNTSFDDLLSDRRYNTLLTGRMHLWKFVYSQHSHSDLWQRLFGTGVSINAHSSYFFLLLFVGKLGLATFLVFNLLLLKSVYDARIDSDLKYVSMIGLAMFLVMGISLTTVLYTSFQWMLYLLVGGVIRIGAENAVRSPSSATAALRGYGELERQF